MNAAAYFDEVQYDYVRLPIERNLVRAQVTTAARSAIIAQFASEAATALHAVGAAVSFDTFGQTTVIAHDDGIGQVLEELAPYLDYYSPMVYPSTWSTGWFGNVYPAADPYAVVLGSVAAAVARLEGYNIVVRRGCRTSTTTALASSTTARPKSPSRSTPPRRRGAPASCSGTPASRTNSPRWLRSRPPASTRRATGQRAGVAQLSPIRFPVNETTISAMPGRRRSRRTAAASVASDWRVRFGPCYVVSTLI